jgi:hypothetical protein
MENLSPHKVFYFRIDPVIGIQLMNIFKQVFDIWFD